MPPPTPPTLTGIVVSAGKMLKTVKVRVATQRWNAHIRKSFAHPVHHLVSDPSSALAVGDVIALRAGWRASKTVRHVVTRILAPFGSPLEARPRVLPFHELLQQREARRNEKRERRARERGEAPQGEFVGKRRARREALAGEGAWKKAWVDAAGGA